MKKSHLVGMYIVAAAAVVCAATLWIFANPLARSAAATAAAPVQAQPGWQAPSPQFLADWDSYRALQAQILKEQLKLQASGAVKRYQGDLDHANGLLTRLQQSVPNGFTFDMDKRFFIPAPKPAPPVAPDPALGAAAKPPTSAIPAPPRK